MKKTFLLILLANFAFADGFGGNILLVPLGFIALLLVFFLVVQKLKLRTKQQDAIELASDDERVWFYTDKTALSYDLQEVFLYFFKTLSYEAGLNNNVLLVRQNMLAREACENNGDKMQINSLFSVDLPSSEQGNLSEKITNPNRKLSRPLRHFFGDYQDVIDGIYACVQLLNSELSNKTIAIDIEQFFGSDNQILLMAEISVCEPQNKQIINLFKTFSKPSDAASVEKMNHLQQIFRKISGAKYQISDGTNQTKCSIKLSIPLIIADSNLPYEVAPKYVIKALVVHENIHIAKTIIKNLNDFNIECVYNKTDEALAQAALDAVNFPYRALFLDAELFASMQPAEQDILLKARANNHFELILVLNNQKSASNIRAQIKSEPAYLAMPYTIDNIRALVNKITNKFERLCK